MESLYNFVQEILNESSIEKAKDRLFNVDGLHINDLKYYENLITQFVRKKDIILGKYNGEIKYNLNEDIKDMWDIVFISQYIYKCWIEERELLKKELVRLKSKPSLTIIESNRINEINSDILLINTYFQKLNKKSELEKVNVLGFNNQSCAQLESKILELKKAILILQKIRDSFEHRNRLKTLDGNIIINNEKNYFSVTIPADYIDGFNKGLIKAKEKDYDVVEKTNEIVYPLLDELNYDPDELESFFYNIRPDFLEYVLELVNYDVNKLYSLPLWKISLAKKAFIELIDVKKYSIDEIKKYPTLLYSEVGTLKILNFIEEEKINIDISKLSVPAIREYDKTCKLLKYFKENGIPIDTYISSRILKNNGYFLKKIVSYRNKIGEKNLYDAISSFKYDFINLYKLLDTQYDLKELNFETFDISSLNKLFDDLNLDADIAYLLIKNSKSQKNLDWIIGNIEKGNFVISNFADVEEKNVFQYSLDRLKLYAKGKCSNNIDEIINYLEKTHISSKLSIQYQLELVDFLIKEDFNIEKYENLLVDEKLIHNYSALKKILEKYNYSRNLIDGKIPFWVIKNFYQNRDFVEFILKNNLNLCAIDDVYVEDNDYQKIIDNHKSEIVSMLEFGKEKNIDEELIIHLNIFEVDELRDLLQSMLNNYGLEKTKQIISTCNYISNIENFKKIVNLSYDYGIDPCYIIPEEYKRPKAMKPDISHDLYIKNIVNFVEIVAKTDRSKLSSKIPWNFGWIYYSHQNEHNIKCLLKTVSTVSELEKYPREFLECDSSVFYELFRKYNVNICKSIFGIDNPKIIASLVYMNSVLSKTDKNSSLDLLDVDPIRFIHGSYIDTIRYTKTTTNRKIDMDQESYLTQFVINDKEEVQRNSDEIKNHIVEKLRNSCAHFRFKLVRDQHNNILEDKIYLYDEYNNGTNNFNIVVNLKDLVEIVRKVELELDSKEGENKKSK